MENILLSVKLKQFKRMMFEHSNYSLGELKENLLVQSNSELLYIIERTLTKEISRISYNKYTNECKWLSNSLKYVIEIISTDNKTHTIEHYDIMGKISGIIVTKINEPKSNLPHSLANFYEEIQNVLNPIIQLLEKTTRDERKKIKQKNDSINLYHFAELLIYKYKNFDYFYQIARTYPNLINSVNEKNVPLVYNLIKKQVRNIKNESNRNNIDYMNRVINFVMSSNYLYLNNKQLNEIVTYLKSEMFNLHKQEDFNIELIDFIDQLCQAFKHLGKGVTFTRDVRDLYKKYGIKEASDIYWPRIEFSNNISAKIEDYTNKETITMDLSKNIRHYDDAVSCEILDNGNYLVGVYIADLTDFIVPNSEIDFIAYDRGETIYLEDRAIDMLPICISSYASLNRGENKKVIAYMFEFTSSGDLYGFSVKQAFINVKNNLNFNTAQKLYHLNHNNEHGKIIKNLIKLNNEREKSKFYNENYHIFKEEKRKVDEQAEYHINNDCSKALSSLMILVNSSIAKFFADNKYPFLYRVNSSNIDDELISRIQKSNSVDGLPLEVTKLVNKVYSRSKYSHINTGHHGLGLGYYCHTTNPIRSYASIITQRMVKEEFIDGGLKDSDLKRYEQILPQIASALNNKIDTHNIFVEEYNKIKKKVK